MTKVKTMNWRNRRGDHNRSKLSVGKILRVNQADGMGIITAQQTNVFASNSLLFQDI